MMEQPEPVPPHFRCGYIAIIGEPNVGKSTLLNGLLRQKISIVTNKPQTTRHTIIGILSGRDYQIVFLDTPGVIRPSYLLQEVMMGYAEAAIDDADIILLMIDATNPQHARPDLQRALLHRLAATSKPKFLVLNKADAVAKVTLLPILAAYAEAVPFRELFPISALKLDGTADLVAAIVAHLPEHPPYFPLDIVSEQSERFFVAEIVREKVFEICREEVPYSTTVDIAEFVEREKGKSLIHANIIVERDSQKQIIIGANGATLRRIGMAARREIEEFLRRPVYLDLFVKVRARWRHDRKWLQRLGYTPR